MSNRQKTLFNVLPAINCRYPSPGVVIQPTVKIRASCTQLKLPALAAACS